MRAKAYRSESLLRRPEAVRVAVIVSAVACLVGAGVLLWSRTGEAVFSDLVLAALAWCF
jgi:hypothetical protein